MSQARPCSAKAAWPTKGTHLMFNRVLILSASAGAGHIRAAEAIEKAFVKLGAAKELRNIDVLESV